MKAIKFLSVSMILSAFLSACSSDLMDGISEGVVTSGENMLIIAGEGKGYWVCPEATSGTIIKTGNGAIGGTITVYNDTENLYVTFTANEGDLLTETNVYIASTLAGLEKVLVSGNGGAGFTNGNMKKQNFVDLKKAGKAEYTYVFSLEELPYGDYVLAGMIGSNNKDLGSNLWVSGYANGQSGISGKNSMYFAFSIVPCIWVPEYDAEEGCGLSQGYWFWNGNGNGSRKVWPVEELEIAGFSYTQEESDAIWTAGNNGIVSKHVFQQVAAAKLSIAAGSVNVENAVTLLNNIAIAEAWLETLGKLSPDNIPNPKNNSDKAKDAASYIANWITSNHCAE